MENVAVMDRTFYKKPKAAEKIVNFFVKNLDSINLQNLELYAYFPHDFDGEILATLTTRIKSFTDYSDLKGDAIRPILDSVGMFKSKTEQLAIHIIGYVSPWKCEEERGFPIQMPCMSVASLMGLREVTLRNGLLSPCQLGCFLDHFQMMAPMRLKKLDLSYSVLQPVEPHILARSVCLLETAIIRGCALSFIQINAIAEKILDWDADWFCLNHLDLAENNNLRQADTAMLAAALTRIETVHIKEYNPKPPSQISSYLFTAIKEYEGSKVRQLELSDVPGWSLSSKLEKLHFNEARFPPDVMLNVLGEKNCSNLKTLEIEDCEGFDSVALNKPFFHLDHLRIKSTIRAKIAQRQTRQIFGSENSFKSFEMVNFDLFQTDPRTLASFVCSGAEKVTLSQCNLTSSHARAVLQEIVARHQECFALSLQSLELDYRGRSLERDLTERVSSLLKLKLTRTKVKGDPKTLKAEGNVAFKAGKYELALEKFSDAIELTNSDEDRAMFLRNRSAVFFKMKNFTAAIQDSTEALALVPNDPTALIRRGLAQENMKQKDLAIKDIKLASTLEPNNAVIKTILTRLQN